MFKSCGEIMKRTERRKTLIKYFLTLCLVVSNLQGMDEEESFTHERGVYELRAEFDFGWADYLGEHGKKELISIDLVHDREVSNHAASKAQYVYKANTLKIENPIPLRIISHITDMEIIKVEEQQTTPGRYTWGKPTQTRVILENFSDYLRLDRTQSEFVAENFIIELFPFGINKDKDKAPEKLFIRIDVTYDTKRDKGLEHDLSLKRENASLKERLHILEKDLARERGGIEKFKMMKSALKVLRDALHEDQ